MNQQNELNKELSKSRWYVRGIKSTWGMLKNIFHAPRKVEKFSIDEEDATKTRPLKDSMNKPHSQTAEQDPTL